MAHGHAQEEALVLRVSGFSCNTDGELAELFFENEDKSRGGDLEIFEWDNDTNEATIVFSDTKVAARVLNSDSLVLDGVKLEVNVYKKEEILTEPSHSAIRVCGFTPGTTKEAVELYFSNPKRSGGGKIEKLVFKPSEQTAIIKFEDPKIVDQIYPDLKLRGSKLHVCAVDFAQVIEDNSDDLHSNGDENCEEPWENEEWKTKRPTENSKENMGKHGNSVENLDEEDIKLLQIKNHQDSRNAGNEVETEEESDTEEDGMLNSKYMETETDSHVAGFSSFENAGSFEIPMDVEDSDEAIAGCSVTSMTSMVYVTNLVPEIDEETLSLYFENNLRSGGGLIKSIEWLDDDQTAIIDFEDAQVAQSVVTKDHTLRKTALQTTLIEGRPKRTSETEDDKPHPVTLEVKCLKPSITEETLKLYFENKRRSGGGPISFLQLKPNGSSAIIQFEEEGVAQAVATKEHILSNTQLQTKLIMGEPEVEIEENVDHAQIDTVEVSGLAPKMDEETISLYFENAKRSGGGPVKSITLGASGTTANIIFHDTQVARNVVSKEHVLCKTKLQTRLVKAEPGVEAIEGAGNSSLDKVATGEDVDHFCFDTVQVSGLKQGTDEETIGLYFENARRSGGGPIKSITLRPSGTTALIVFQDAEVAQSVVSKEHVLGKTKLQTKLLTGELEVDTDNEVGHISQDTVQVSGLKQGTDEETIGLYFENAKRSGGGPVKSITLGPSGTTAMIVFQDAKVVPSVLSHPELKLNGNILRVSVPSNKPNPKAGCTIEVTGFHVNTARDALVSFFSDRKRSGGGPVEDVVFLPIREMALVSFREETALQGVFSKKRLFLDGLELHVAFHKEITAAPVEDDTSEKMEAKTYVRVQGIPKTTSRETFINLFQNRKRSGGGPIRKIHLFDPAKQSALVEYEDNHDAEEVLQFKGLKLGGTVLSVSATKSHQLRDNKENSKSIKVKGISENIAEETLLFFFENTRRSGGGPVETMDMDLTKGEAIVTFKEPGVAERVSELHDFVLNQKNLQVTLCVENVVMDETDISYDSESNLSDEDIPHYGRSCAILVSGVSPDTSQDTLEMYFKNRRRSGGGDVKKVFLDRHTGQFTITFDSPEVIDRVVQKSHKLESSILVVTPLKSVHTRHIDGATVPDQVLVRGLNPGISRDRLELHLEAISKCGIGDICFSPDPSVALVQFDRAPNFERLSHHCCCYPLENTMLGVEKVPVPLQAQVFGIHGIAEDSLSLYFENARRSGGCDGIKLQYNYEENFAILTCPSSQVLSQVLGKAHSFDGRNLQVGVFCEGLGVIPPGFDTKDPIRVPDHTRVKIGNDTIATFVLKSAWAHDIVDELLQPIAAKVDWAQTTANDVHIKCLLNKTDRRSAVLGQNWEKDVREKILVKFVSQLDTFQVTTIQQVWGKLSEEIHTKTPPPEVCIFEDNVTCSFVVVGLRERAQEIHMAIQGLENAAQVDMMRKAKSAKETMFLTPIKVCALSIFPFRDAVISKFPQMNIDFNPKKGCVTLEGLPREVKDAKMTGFEMLNSSGTSRYELPPIKLQLLSMPETRMFLEGLFQEKNILACWECDNDELELLGKTPADTDRAFSVIKEEVSHVDLDIDKSSVVAIHSKAWVELITKMMESNKGQLLIHVDVEANREKVRVAYLSRHGEICMENIRMFLDSNTVLQTEVALAPGPAKVICEHLERDILEIENDLKNYSVNIINKSRPNAFTFHLSGNKEGLALAQKRLADLEKTICSRNHTIDKPGMPKYFTSGNGVDFLQNLQSRHKVVIMNEAEEAAMTDRGWNSPHTRSGSVTTQDQELCRVKDRHGPEISVLLGDLTVHKVDAIVNAANADLEHAGGLARALADRGGPEIQRDSKRYVSRNGRVDVGKVVETKAGKLPCKHLLHAVGPRWEGGHYEEANLLYETVYNCLELASKLGAASIAVPAISTGVFGYPLDNAVRIIVDAVRDYCKKEARKNKLSEIHLISSAEKTTQALHREVQLAYGQSIQHKPYNHHRSPSSPGRSISKGISRSQSRYKRSGSRNIIVTTEGLSVTLVSGNIAEQKVDAILNVTSRSLNLRAGALSSAILEAAGPALQEECSQKYPRGVRDGEIAVTKGHDLNCPYVFHGSCPKWDGGHRGSERVICDLVSQCLSEANDLGLYSIALPPIGTGRLGVPKDVAAKMMLDEVAAFSNLNRRTLGLKDVVLVVYSKDRNTLQAFEDELEQQIGERRGPTAISRRGQNRPYHGNDEYASSSVASSHFNSDSSDESEYVFGSVDLPSHGQQQMTIGSISLQVQQGDITRETTDAIVNSTNSKLALGYGAVSKAIVRAGGPEIEEDCLRIGGLTDGIAVTSAGRLPTDSIIHVDAHAREGWAKIINRTLKTADDLKMRSIAFPALGTGQRNSNVEEMAATMMEAIAKFCHKNKPKYLGTVRVTIFQEDMLDLFHQEMVRKGRKKGFLAGMKEDFKDFYHETKDYFLASDPQPKHEGGRYPHRSRKGAAFTTGKITFNIYGTSEESLGAVIRKISDKCKSSSTVTVIGGTPGQADADAVKDLSRYEVDEISNLGKTYDVIVNIVQQPRINKIEVKGETTEVLATVNKIHSILRKSESTKFRKQEASFIKDKILWEHHISADWRAYPQGINAQIEKAYKQKDPYVDWQDTRRSRAGSSYRINFKTMKMSTSGTQNQADVRRRDLAEVSANVPNAWKPMPVDQHFCLCQLANTDPDYKRVETLWRQTLANAATTLVKIELVQNPSIYRRYMVSKQHMDAVNPKGHVNERELWHGTSSASIQSINTQGFNRSYCGAHGTAIGQGVYFATSSAYSAGYSAKAASVAHALHALPNMGARQMYLAKVLVGESTRGASNMRVPPAKNPANPSVLYDSVTDNPAGGSMYVVFNDTAAYPYYLLTFT